MLNREGKETQHKMMTSKNNSVYGGNSFMSNSVSNSFAAGKNSDPYAPNSVRNNMRPKKTLPVKKRPSNNSVLSQTAKKEAQTLL